MEGMKFMIVNQKNQAVNHGVIIQQITPERYLCQFQRRPTSCRVCRLEEIEGWNLFPTDEAMNAFLASLQPPQEKSTGKKAKSNGKKSKKKAKKGNGK